MSFFWYLFVVPGGLSHMRREAFCLLEGFMVFPLGDDEINIYRRLIANQQFSEWCVLHGYTSNMVWPYFKFSRN